MSDVVFEKRGNTGVITLNRSKALNALTLDMIKMMQNQLSAWRDDDSITCVLTMSNSEKAFCAGGDVRWLYDMGRAKNPQQLQFFWHEYRLNHYIKHYPKPYVSLLNGITMGGGVGISLHGSHPIASENFSFAMPETGIGFFPDIGGGYLLSRAYGEVGTYLGLTGKRITVFDAVDAGLLKATLKASAIEDFVEQLLGGQEINSLTEKFKLDPQASAISEYRHIIDECFCFDSVAEIMAALKKNSSEFSLKVLSQLEKKSPTSLKLTLAQLRRAKTLSMGECMQMEYRMVNHCMQQVDFYEGVRALLVDKDNQPQWQPNVLSDVSDADIDKYFEELEVELELIDN